MKQRVYVWLYYHWVYQLEIKEPHIRSKDYKLLQTYKEKIKRITHEV